MAAVEIPNRAVFRAAEVCELAAVQPYVLRGWEAEFPDLGVAKTAGAPRVYRKVDVERVLRLKHLILVDGLTLGGARKKLIEEGALKPAPEDVSESDVTAMMDELARSGLHEVKRGLQWILNVLGGQGTGGEFALRAQPAHVAARAGTTKKVPAKPAKSKKGKGKR